MPKSKRGYLAVSEKDKTISIMEKFKGEVSDTNIKYPKELGVEHPFEFEDAEKLMKKCGLVSETINKFTDAIVSDFSIEVDNANAQAVIDSFVKDSNMDIKLRGWIREGFGKGSGFMGIDLNENKIQVLNANNMYVKRDKKGNIKKYNQWLGKLKNFNSNSNKLNDFEPNEIAHLPINSIAGEAYGLGIIYPNERIIENMIKNEQDLQKLVERKAGAPYHIKVGEPGTNTPSKIVDDISTKMQYMNNRTEWVTDSAVDIKSIDFANLPSNLTDAQMYWFRQYIAAVGIPEVLLGSGQLNEGIAKVQLENFRQKVESYQLLVEKVISEKVIKPLLLANGFDIDVSFIWNLPSEDEINKKLEMYQKYMNTPASAALKASLEIKIARLIGDEDLVDVLKTPQEAQKEEDEMKKQMMEDEKDPEREKEEEIPQPETPGAKPNANELKKALIVDKDTAQNEKHKISMEESREMTLKDWVNIKELEGFNYSQYTEEILDLLKIDKFEQLRAVTEEQIRNGLFPEKDIEKLRLILKDGFSKNRTIKQIEDDIANSINVKDRVTENGNKVPAEVRPNMIARTETVRLANDALENMYKDKGIKKVRFLSALSDRTCPRCLPLNGQVFEIDKLNTGENKPPIHTNCFLHHSVKINTDKGIKNINEISVGDRVLTHKGRYREVISVLDKKERYKGKAIEIRYKGNKFGDTNKRNSVAVTPEHPFLTQRGWVEAENLIENDKLYVLANSCLSCGKKIPYWKSFCSSKCVMNDEIKGKISKKNSGENNGMYGKTKELHPRWQGGKIWWRGKDWDETKLKVRERDKFICQNCGISEEEHINKTGQPLQVHHINPYRLSKDNSLNNLITFCASCHQKLEGTDCREVLESGGAEFIEVSIKEIRKLGDYNGERLYNFEVEEDNSYIADGIVTHNCRCSLVGVVE